MTTKHTSAHWELKKHGAMPNGVVMYFVNENTSIGTAIEYDAKLIAAAPDLLEALLNFVNHGSCFDEQDMQQARKAIEKATN